PITDGSTSDTTVGWSPDGNWYYLSSDRDGFTGCVWACRLDPKTSKPIGMPIPIVHNHSTRLSRRNADPVSQNLGVARDKIVFNMGEITGNIWMTELSRDGK